MTEISPIAQNVINFVNQTQKSIFLTGKAGSLATTTNGKNTYNYKYDRLSRITDADFAGANALGITTKMYNGSTSYDANGNIQYMSRAVGGVNKDILNYTYTNGNQLGNVTDAGDITSLFKGKAGGARYTYDANGNMTADGNKDLTINYNYLNLPGAITRTAGATGYVKNYYAGATKIRSVTYTAATNKTKTYDYMAGMVYAQEDALAPKTLDFVATPEGRAMSTKTLLSLSAEPLTGDKLRYEYNLKDHLGNLRVSCRCDEIKRNANGLPYPETDANYGFIPLKAVQEIAYDPWGLNFGNTTDSQKLSTLTDRYQFLGRESVVEIGWVDLMQRMYDPPTGRFISVDPKPDVAGQESLTTYQYGYNNPIRYSDPNGDCPTCFTAGIGALIKGGIELGGQLISNGGNFNDVDWADVGVEAGKGVFAGSGAGLFAIAAAEVGGALVKGSIDIKTGSGSKNIFDGSKTKTEAAFDAGTDYAAGKIGDVGAKKIGGVLGDLAKKTDRISNTSNRALSIAKNYVKETVSDQTRNQGAKQYVKVLTNEAAVANAKKQATATISKVAKSSAGNVANDGFQNKAIDYVKSFFNF